MWALFIILCYDALGHTNWICACKCAYVPNLCVSACVCVPVCRPQHTDGRLIKQLIKARALGSEMRLLLFGKNCSTRHKGKKNWKGRGEKRELGESEYHRHGPGMCQSLSYGAPPPPPPPPPSRGLTLSPFFCICMSPRVRVHARRTLRRFRRSLTVIINLRKLFKSKPVSAEIPQDESANSSRRPRAEERTVSEGQIKNKVDASDVPASRIGSMRCACWCVRGIKFRCECNSCVVLSLLAWLPVCSPPRPDL